MKGRKPKPTGLRLIEGNREHRTIHAELEPKPDNVAPPRPIELRKGPECKAWSYLVQELGKMGILASSDKAQMTGYCFAWGLWCKAKHEMDTSPHGIVWSDKQSPWLRIANKAMEDVIKYGAELGLNPVQRTRVKLEKPVPGTRRGKLLG